MPHAGLMVCLHRMMLWKLTLRGNNNGQSCDLCSLRQRSSSLHSTDGRIERWGRVGDKQTVIGRGRGRGGCFDKARRIVWQEVLNKFRNSLSMAKRIEELVLLKLMSCPHKRRISNWTYHTSKRIFTQNAFLRLKTWDSGKKCMVYSHISKPEINCRKCCQILGSRSIWNTFISC